MDFSDFQTKYRRKIKSLKLKQAKNSLRIILKQRLKPFQSADLFRPRLVEARVKTPRSLYDKILSRGLDHERVLDMCDHVMYDPSDVSRFDESAKSYMKVIQDLIGARVVCHNISDLQRIHRALEGDQRLKLQEPDPKPFDEIADGDVSGYRGRHRCVIWWHDNTQYVGELQIRTILQDAWASFMHDDIYEHGVKDDIVSDLMPALKQGSDLLYVLDVMADHLRTSIQNRTKDALSLLDTLTYGLLGMHAFSTNIKAPPYAKVVRNDVFRVIGLDGQYEIEIHATLPRGTELPFEFYLSGDTEAAANAHINLVMDLDDETDLLQQHKYFQIDKGPSELLEEKYLVRLRHQRPRNKHNYKINCIWTGTFSRRFRYLHIPWQRYYQTPGEYTLQLVVDRRCSFEPRLLTIQEAWNVFAELHSTGKMLEKGMKGQKTSRRQETTFTWSWSEYNKDAIVVWCFA